MRGIRFAWTAAACAAAFGLLLTASGQPQERQADVPKELKAPGRLAMRMNPAIIRRSDPEWQYAKREVYAKQASLQKRLNAMDVDGLKGFVLKHGPLHSKVIALTFDDGPHPAFTPKLLKVLKENNIKVTFFVVGFMAEKRPDLLRLITAEGHEIASHTYSHVNLTKLQHSQALVELQAANQVIKKITGRRPAYFRPPGGDFSVDTLKMAASLGLTTVLWTNDPGDYDNPPCQVLLRRVFKTLDGGDIILLHDGPSDTLASLTAFIQGAKKRGYRFVTISEMDRMTVDR